ncbi:MAG TPA: hypothetical protein PLS49_04090, partial [Candidatus Woesebacteria bacterium]|nr:hypothetical protein [Candidatus Woesebacteria bacterium]
WNSIPTVNNTVANVVIGQPDFTTNSTPVTAAGLNIPISVFSNNNRLYIADNNNNRVLIFNKIPTINGISADIVLGQTNFTSNANVGITSYSMQNPQMVFEYQDKLFVSEAGGDRILIFKNIISKPGISINNSPEDIENNKIRMNGISRVEEPYVVQSVEYSVNGGGWSHAKATDGSFDSISEDFYIEFDPKSNNYEGDGYTVRFRSTNNNTDVTDNLFYFSPFNLHAPSNNSYTTNELPTFEFTVNQGRFQDLRDNLSKFQVLINKDNQGWQTYIDTIPVSYESIKNSGDNTLPAESNTKGNGTFESNNIWVQYTNDNSHIKVYSKAVDNDGNPSDAYFNQGGKKLSAGSYQWKVVAIDKSGHSQETATRILRINTRQVIASTTFFPLAVLNITGIGNLHMTTIHPHEVQRQYTTWSKNPIFYGIANVGSQVQLELTDTTCQEKGEQDCLQIYTTTTNAESRFGINVPSNSLISGKTYDARMFVSLENNYNELPNFDLVVQ